MTHPAAPLSLALFATASLVLAITPGPAVIYLVTRTLSQGRPAGFASIGGVALGNLGNAALASLGLAVIFAVSTQAFMLVKLAGAAYLVFLGIKSLRATPASQLTAPVAHVSRATALRDGFWVALLNPKTALFFAAFLPQFVDPGRAPLLQSLGLSALFVLIAVCTDTLYVLAADRLGMRLGRRSRAGSVGRYVSGFSFIALGLLVACSGWRSDR